MHYRLRYTLTKSKENRDSFSDYEWLMSLNLSKAIVLTGDIHENAYRVHQGASELVEVVSSGTARPGLGGDTGNYGLLDVQDNKVEVKLFDREGLMIQKAVDR